MDSSQEAHGSHPQTTQLVMPPWFWAYSNQLLMAVSHNPIIFRILQTTLMRSILNSFKAIVFEMLGIQQDETLMAGKRVEPPLKPTYLSAPSQMKVLWPKLL